MMNNEKRLCLSSLLKDLFFDYKFRDYRYLILLLSIVLIGCSVRAQSAMVNSVVTSYGSFKNPYKEIRSRKLKTFVTKVRQFNVFIAENGKSLSKKETKKYLNKYGLKSAKKEFELANDKYNKLNRFLYTFKTAMPLDYNYFNALKDQSGEKVSLVIFLNGGSSPYKDSRVVATTSIIPMAVNYSYDGQGKVKDYKIIGVKDNMIEITLWSGGINIPRLGNELGDIKHFFMHVNDKKSLAYFSDTGNGMKNIAYYEDEEGTGIKSFIFERKMKDSIKAYAKHHGLELNADYSIK